MIAVLQRVKRASVDVEGQTVGKCAHGLCVLLGVAKEDTEEDAEALVKKLVELRIFCDENDKMNLSVKDVGVELLVISNFTLLAAYRKGRRPDYINAASPAEANRLYEYFKGLMAGELRHIGCGVFGAHMEVSLINNGPVTICMDSEVLKKKKA